MRQGASLHLKSINYINMKKILAIGLSMICLAMSAQTSYNAHEPGTNNYKPRELRLNIDADLFLVNNEFTTLMKGYTLPGFRFTPTLSYAPAKNVKIEGGAYLLHYWGANEYPNSNYLSIPDYDPEHSSKGLHALPFLRAVATAPCGVTFVLGNIYGAEKHRLLPQLYSPELALTADPEAGLQILYNRPWADFDLWVDWRNFIYNNSPYRENFFVGLSSNFRYNSPSANVHFYSPLQALLEHRGGEIDTDAVPGVNTMINAAAGFGAQFNINPKGLKYVRMEADFLASFQQAGKAWPYDNGTAWYAHADADYRGLEASLGYYRAHKFMPLLGMPLWGVASAKYPGMLLDDPQTLTLSLSYSYTFTPGFS
ncbi:MAG: hypothetical protein NC548_62205, partial [Lachnospiraceae bacterium]|nr:hypothetical protein [Lachnospiraceae bacterium]